MGLTVLDCSHDEESEEGVKFSMHDVHTFSSQDLHPTGQAIQLPELD